LNANFAAAQSGVRYEAQPGSKVKIEGTSTVHDWVVEGQIIRGFMQLGFNPQNAANLKPGKVDAKVEASIPVRSLKSGKAAMDAVMHDAMKQKTSPIIEYHLNELVLKESPKSADSPLEFESKGELSVAGVTNKITMPVTMTRAEKIMKTSGTTSLKMTSFGIKPPAPKIALGFISTGDDVKMTFEWVTALQEKTAEAKSP
jgi:hypothetical protein